MENDQTSAEKIKRRSFFAEAITGLAALMGCIPLAGHLFRKGSRSPGHDRAVTIVIHPLAVPRTMKGPKQNG